MGWNLIGLERTTATLSAMISNGRLPHALLLTGPRGCGKSSLAIALAAALNCASPEADGAPCGQCLACEKTVRGLHPDVSIAVPSGRSRQIKMEDVRKLRSEVAFRPYEGRAKIFIIKEANRLNQDAGNALLKTLEEPPPNSLLILTGASEADVLPTILSRCLRLKVPPLPMDLIMNLLKERRGLSGPQAQLLAGLAAGALGPALELDPDETWQLWDELNKIMEAKGPSRLEAAWAWAAAKAGDEDGYKLIFTILRLWWRETILLHGGGHYREGPPASPAQQLWADRLNSESIMQVQKIQARLEDSLARFIKPELAFENYWLSIFNAAWKAQPLAS